MDNTFTFSKIQFKRKFSRVSKPKLKHKKLYECGSILNNS